MSQQLSVTNTLTSNIFAEPTTTTYGTSVNFIAISSTSVDEIIKIDYLYIQSKHLVQAQVHNDSCTTTLLAVVVPIGCTVIAIVLLITNYYTSLL